MSPTKLIEGVKNATEGLDVGVLAGGSHIAEAANQQKLQSITRDALADVLEHLENHGLTMAQMATIAECSQSAISKFRRNTLVFTPARAYTILSAIERWTRSLNDVPYRRSRN